MDLKDNNLFSTVYHINMIKNTVVTIIGIKFQRCFKLNNMTLIQYYLKKYNKVHDFSTVCKICLIIIIMHTGNIQATYSV